MDKTGSNNAHYGNKAQSTDLLGIGSWAETVPKRDDIGNQQGVWNTASIMEKGKSGTDTMSRWLSESKKDSPWLPGRKS